MANLSGLQLKRYHKRKRLIYLLEVVLKAFFLRHALFLYRDLGPLHDDLPDQFLLDHSFIVELVDVAVESGICPVIHVGVLLFFCFFLWW